MEGLSQFSFVSPWAFSTLLFLPLLWYVLKTTPPKPKVIPFPAVRLLQELTSQRLLAARTPWWVLLLRGLLLLCLIIALAGPVLNATQSNQTNQVPHIILIDNDWSVMDRWDQRHQELLRLVASAKDTEQSVYIMGTSQPVPFEQKPHSRLVYEAEHLSAHPWPTAHEAVLHSIKELQSTLSTRPKISWISNGLSDPQENLFLQDLLQIGDVEYITESTLPPLPVLHNVTRKGKGFHIGLTELTFPSNKALELQFLDGEAQVLLQKKYELNAGEKVHEQFIDIPQELKSRTERIRIAGFTNPGAQYLLDEKWRDQSVGLIAPKGSDKALLAPSYYVEKSLAPYSHLQIASLNDLLDQSLSLIIDVDYTAFPPQQNERLENWVQQGGIFVRFASARKSDTKDGTSFDPLLPVQLMPGERTFGGSLSWDKPHRLAPFDSHSPFFGLPVPDDISINKQILARPSADLSEKTWARLSDGTPLVTAAQMGRGWSILFHIEAVPGWSKLPLSGTFEQMLKRLLSLTTRKSTAVQDGPLSPYRLFDRNGFLSATSTQFTPITSNELESQSPDFSHPPGLYGTSQAPKAYNLGPFVKDMTALDSIPSTVTQRTFHKASEQDLSLWFLFAAFLLALLDWLLSIRFKTVGVISGAVLGVMLFSIMPAHSETDWDKALAAANQMRLAYMQSHDPQLNETLERGLNGLGTTLRRRTAVELAPAMAFDPEKDDPSLFPMIYWAIEDQQTILSPQATEKLNRFLKTGGFILFDTMGQDRPALLAQATANLDIAPLDPVGETHVLTRAFYLLQRFPGRFDFDGVWVESDGDTKNDRVSSVLIGRNAWAQAWARDDNLRPLYPVIPGGELQREQAMRFGINLVMYILSGNYKGDQVHIPAILQRLGL